MSTLRAIAKLMLERAQVASPLVPYHRNRRRGQSIILAYHNVIPDRMAPRGDRSLHLPRAAFARQLDMLMREYEIVPLSDLLSDRAEGRQRLAITFDDAYLGAVTLAVDELRKRSLPAVVFTAPGILGGVTPWWDQVGNAFRDGVPEPLRVRALEEFAGRGREILKHVRGDGLSPEPDPELRTATEAELQSAMSYEGISLASHSWSHPNLARIPREELSRELGESHAWLRARFARTLPWISYPYGAYSAEVERASADAGYTHGFTISPGWTQLGIAAPHAVPRLNVPAGISEPGLALRICRAPRFASGG